MSCSGQAGASSHSSPSQPTPAAFRAPIWSQPQCGPPSPSTPIGTGGQELQGRAEPPPAQFWAVTSQPVWPPVGKVVMRITGSGPLHVWEDGPDGLQVVSPKLQAHSSSDWNRPGDEWGGNLWFPVTGCWTVQAQRTNVNGEISLLVSSRS